MFFTSYFLPIMLLLWTHVAYANVTRRLTVQTTISVITITEYIAPYEYHFPLWTNSTKEIETQCLSIIRLACRTLLLVNTISTFVCEGPPTLWTSQELPGVSARQLLVAIKQTKECVWLLLTRHQCWRTFTVTWSDPREKRDCESRDVRISISSQREPTIWNDIPKDFKPASYFRFCRLYKYNLNEHPLSN